MIASGLLNFLRCCALRLEGKSQVGIIPICVSSEGRIMPCCTISSRLPTLLVLAGMHPVYFVKLLLKHSMSSLPACFYCFFFLFLTLFSAL